jgi:hypothetical protein
MRADRILLWLCVALLSACQTMGEREDSPHYAVPVGSTLVLNRPVEIPPYQAGVYLQAGQVAPGVNRYAPHCRFELTTVAERAQRVEPDRFLVRRVSRPWGQTRAPTEPVHVAGVHIGIGVVFGVGGSRQDGPGLAILRTVLDLSSERQPQVYRLTCEQWDDFARARHVTVREIREALGELFTLQIPD